MARGIETYITASGKPMYRARLRRYGRLWRSALVPTKAEARQIYEDKKRELRRAQYSPDQPLTPNRTIADLFAEYLPLVKEREAFREQQRFARYWTETLGTRLVMGLSVRDLEDARRDLRDGGRSIGTVNHYLKCLRHAMRLIIVPRSWVIDLWAHLKLETPKSVSPTILSPDQEAALQAQLGGRDLCTVRLALLIGLRRGQFFGLRWDWLLWDLSAFRVPGFKRQPARMVAVPQEGMTILADMHHIQGQPLSGFLFPHPTKEGASLVANDWYRYHFKAACRRAGLYDLGVTFHSLRHTWATRQLQGGANPRTVQRAGAWSSLALVERYTQAFDEDVRRAVECAATIGPKKQNESIMKVSLKKGDSSDSRITG